MNLFRRSCAAPRSITGGSGDVGRPPCECEGLATGHSFYSVEKVPEARSGGATQAETRVYNERLVVSLIRRHNQLSKVDLTRLTGLAPQDQSAPS